MPEKILRCAIYIRVSTFEQSVHGKSLQAQKECLEQYATDNNMSIVGVYADEGKTARKELKKRKAIHALVEDVKRDKIDVIIFWRLDRWFRNLSDFYKVQDVLDDHGVHAFIVGEHGDSEIAAWSSANVSGIPLHDFCEMRGHHDHEGATSEIAEKVKNSAYEIIQRKGATYYGIAMSVKRICEAIIRDERSILQISTMMDGEYGIKDVVLSMPSIVGAEGFISKVPISLSEDEIKALHKSAETLKSVLEEALE